MRRVAIFAHYDPQNSIKRYIVHHLTALRECVTRFTLHRPRSSRMKN
jgi:lipopolysaccharide biosynthesis protein